jgi:murein DD-endopeptidase MepM/ murein hydrolase activator NlpD
VTAETGWYGYTAPQEQGYYQPQYQQHAQPGYPQQEYPAGYVPQQYAHSTGYDGYQYVEQQQYQPQQPQPYAQQQQHYYYEPAGEPTYAYAAPLPEQSYPVEYQGEALNDTLPVYEQEFEHSAFEADVFHDGEFNGGDEPEPEAQTEAQADEEPPAAPADPHLVTGGRAAARAARSRSTRRRSAVLTIAVPSVAVLGIAGAAAATLAPEGTHRPVVASDAGHQLTVADQKAQAEAAAQARASAEQASRDQARQALALRTAAAKKAAAEAPRYVLPITAHTGLSALFGQAGTHWMQLHTGIDFPVSTGTSVHAVTDGTISTKWNAYYGNMLMLTAPDGTQTWYCHLSAYKMRSGAVKAGDIIAYSGDTGNSTGPHLHFEVHPDGGPAIDPLPWLLAHNLDPR